MVAQQPATLLAVLVEHSDRTHEEIAEEFRRCARENREEVALSARTLRRWMKGGVRTAPRPAHQRVAELYWGYPMATLLGPAPPPGTPITSPALPDGWVTTDHRRPQPPRPGDRTAVATSPLDGLEALRHRLLHLCDAGSDEWEAIAAAHATTYFELAPAELINQLGANLIVLGQVLAARQHDTSQYRVAAQPSGMMSCALVSDHQVLLARRWWHTARQCADLARNLETRAWVDGLEVVSGTYERRPTRQIVDLADAAISQVRDHVCCGSVGVWAGRAQALALAGNAEEAIDALRKTADLTERMPAPVMADAGSLFGWPEVRLRHTESYVYTHLGMTDQAMAAQDRALEIYPVELGRERAQLELHRAKCHILRGDIGDGLTYAADVLDDLPANLHNAKLYEVGRHAILAVPRHERRRPEYGELRARLLALSWER